MTTRDAKRFMKMSFLCLQIDTETMNARDLYYHIRHETNMLEADMFMSRELLEDIYETELPEPDDLSEEMEFLNECIKKVDAVIKEGKRRKMTFGSSVDNFNDWVEKCRAAKAEYDKQLEAIYKKTK